MPFVDLLFHAQRVHRAHHAPSTVQMSTLLSIKTGACPEDCAYCPQSVRYDTGVEREALMRGGRGAGCRAQRQGGRRHSLLHGCGVSLAEGEGSGGDQGDDLARCARSASRRAPRSACSRPRRRTELKDAGLDYYNHNLDTSPEFYGEIITTRTYQDRLDTLDAVRDAGMKVCCGGIVGMGETPTDRAQLLITLANLPEHPESVPINNLVQVPGTPLHGRSLRRSVRLRAHDRRRARAHAPLARAPFRRPRRDER